jgi:hypothetical protein
MLLETGPNLRDRIELIGFARPHNEHTLKLRPITTMGLLYYLSVFKYVPNH